MAKVEFRVETRMRRQRLGVTILSVLSRVTWLLPRRVDMAIATWIIGRVVVLEARVNGGAWVRVRADEIEE